MTELTYELGPEGTRLDSHLASRMDEGTRAGIWSAVESILGEGPIAVPNRAIRTGLALGYVQSGKTTSITALTAAASDAGYRIIIALLGSTNLLLGQNQQRLEAALGIGQREDYVWVVEPNPSGTGAAKRIGNWLGRGRTVVIPVLKHAGRIRSVAGVLERLDLGGSRALIIDDEADQASLNTQGANAESRTYESIREMREKLPQHLYVQYTATPYAPLLLEADDLLLPEFVEFLHPGPGYVGGREFFVDFASQVVRDVPALEEQATKQLPLTLPASLVAALGSFIAGAALLLESDPLGAPVSMLVHSGFEHHAELPQVELEGAVATVLVGEVAGVASPARRDTDHAGIDLDLRPGRATFPLRPDYEHALVVFAGTCIVDGAVLEPGHLAYLGVGRDEITLTTKAPTRALLVGGVPFDEQVLMWWNFVARTRDEIVDAHRDWTAGADRFGHVDSELARFDVDPPPWRRQ